MTPKTAPGKTAVIVAGGTGGHLYPGIAVARAIVQKKPWTAVFMVRRGDLGRSLLQREKFQVIEMSGQGMPRGLSWKLLKFPFIQAAALKEAWTALGRLKPDVVIGMGGYLSFPVLIAARLRRIPTLIHEQNVYPGVANRFLGPWVQSVAVSFPESRTAFSSRKVWVSGLPVRPDIGGVGRAEGLRRFQLSKDTLTVLVFGGSLGAHRINEAAVDAWPMLGAPGAFQVLHVTGNRDHAEIARRYQQQKGQAVVVPYCHDMAAALAAADFVVCRAGASTVAELIVAHRPALLIPFPFASENHQFYNAEVLVKQGAADMLLDADVTAERLAERVGLYLNDPDRLTQMRKRLEALAAKSPHANAAARIAERMTG